MIPISFQLYPRLEDKMPKRTKADKASSANLSEFGDATEKKKKKQRQELLTAVGVTEFFTEGSIRINKRTCKGVECRLCLKACPTSALFWKSGEVGIVSELCIYCGACVLSCIVDDCIRIERKRSSGQIESFSNMKDFMKLQGEINSVKRYERIEGIKEMLPKPKDLIGERKSRVEKKQSS